MPRSIRPRKLSASKKPTTARLVALRAPATITITAAREGEQPGPPSFRAELYAGGPLPGYTAKLDFPVVVDLAGMTARRNLIANLDHAPKQRVGHISELTNDKKTLSASGLLSAATPHRDEVVNSSKEGFTWEVSMECDLNASSLSFLAAGKQVIVNGQTVTGPLYIARKSVLLGLAFVSEGAEDGNSVSIAASKKGATMDPFEKWLEEKGWESDTLTETQRTTLKATFDREQQGDTLPLNADRPRSVEEAVAAQRVENDRVTRINEMTSRALRAASGRQLDTIELLAKRAIDDGWGADRYELELHRTNMPQASTFRTGGRSEPDGRILEAALARNAGLPDIEKHYAPELLQQVDDHRLRGLGLQQLLMQAAAQNGYDARPGERITTGNLRTVLEYAFPVGPQAHRLRAAASTFSLPDILGNVANKELLVGFTESVDPVIGQISAAKSANNFYTRTHVRLTDSLKFEKVGPSGEIKHGKLGQEKYETKLDTYARFLGLNRQDIINDDLGALDSLRLRIGGGGAMALNELFWTVWLDDDAFWTLTRGNYIEGADTTLLVDGVGLAKAEVALAKLKTADGKRITIQAAFLLTPPELDLTSRRLYVSSNVNTGGAATAESVPNANAFANKYRPLMSGFLSDAAIAGSSTTAWWLLRDPRTYPAAVVSYLNGQQTPTVESAAADFDVLGVSFRGIFDFDIALAEWLAGIKSKGAPA